MRLSCNGCRVLRRGCNPECPIRPCLHWIHSPDSQANATLFLAKFYGRAGLLNLLTAAPQQLQPAVFKSLLYEACGRIVNPVFGSTGLLSTGSWHLCEAAVKAVLSGAPIQQAPSFDGAVSLQLQACDIRHVAKSVGQSCGSDRLHKVKSHTRQFKRRGLKPKQEVVVACCGSKLEGSVSHHESGVSDSSSVESVAPAHDDQELELELTLTLGCGVQ
ncbi:Lateral organ boundary [Sesbania bispinosa]|nr:Lateral organ boundary [Sesbania bispinosa]